MKVKELIEQLQQYPEDADVFGLEFPNSMDDPETYSIEDVFSGLENDSIISAVYVA